MGKIFSNEPHLPRPELFSELVELKINIIREFEELVKQGINDENRRIEKEKRDLKLGEFDSEYEFDSYCDSLNDNLFQMAEIEKTLRLLMAVRLMIIVEEVTKSILKWTLQSESEEEQSKFLKDMSYQKRLREKMDSLNINIEDITEFLTIDELRCLCNTIKHSGLVDEGFSKFAIWSNDIGKEIDPTKINLERFYEAIPKYIFDLTEKVKDYLISIQSDKLSKPRQA